MAPGPTIRVKLSSEDAGSISLTPVVVEEMSLGKLVEHVVIAIGKDAPRLREVLRRGSFVSGGTRFRWAGWEIDDASLAGALAAFPDADPARAFAPQRCTAAVLRGARHAVPVPREIAARHGWFRRKSFWDALMAKAGAQPVYGGYSYRERADYYLTALAAAAVEELRADAGQLVSGALRGQVRAAQFDRMELFVPRG